MKRSLFFTFGLFLFAGSAAIASKADIQFPIVELGACENENACFSYCEKTSNYEACYAFGKENGLITDDENINPKILETLAAGGGPGACPSRVACEAYCSDAEHLVECVTFAETNGLMNGEELEEAKKVLAAVQSGATLPGGCKNKDACESYCQQPSHMEECIAFAEAAGFMTTEEIQRARTILPLMQSGQTPGGCTSEDACRDYCESGNHMDECLDFGVKSGFMTQEEVDQMKTSGQNMMRRSEGCTSEETCAQLKEEQEFNDDTFGDDRSREEFIGPGGCTSREECETYCRANPEACKEMMNELSQQKDAQEGSMPLNTGCSSPEECMKPVVTIIDENP